MEIEEWGQQNVVLSHIHTHTPHTTAPSALDAYIWNLSMSLPNSASYGFSPDIVIIEILEMTEMGSS